MNRNRFPTPDRLGDGPRRTRTARRRAPRRAAVLAVVLVSLLVILLLGAALVEALLLRARQVRSQQQQWQALWLAEAAIDRAAARLDIDANYAGETWRVALDGGDGEVAGVAHIEVTAAADQPRQRTIRVAAHWPDDPLRRVVQRHELTVTLPDSGEAP